jgi:hypothetical protein
MFNVFPSALSLPKYFFASDRVITTLLGLASAVAGLPSRNVYENILNTPGSLA